MRLKDFTELNKRTKRPTKPGKYFIFNICTDSDIPPLSDEIEIKAGEHCAQFPPWSAWLTENEYKAEQYCNVKEAAKLTGFASQTVYKFLGDGCFPRSKKLRGTTWRVSKDDIEQLVNGEKKIVWIKVDGTDVRKWVDGEA